MTTEEIFGRSQLVSEVGPGSPVIDTPAKLRNESMLDGWTGHLQCVDEALMLRVWRRLLADQAAVSDLRSDGFLSELHRAIDEPQRIPADTNASFLAKALGECSDTNRLLPLVDSPPTRDGELVRVFGSITALRGTAVGCTLRLSAGGSKSFLVRFSRQAFLVDPPHRLHGTEALVLAIVQDARRLELAGVALLVRNHL